MYLWDPGEELLQATGVVGGGVLQVAPEHLHISLLDAL